MVDAIDRPEKAQYHLVSFTYGDPEQTRRFTNWDSDVDPGGLTYTSVPEMEIDLAPNVGIFGEQSSKIKLVIQTETQTLLDPLTRGTPFAPVKVVIQEIIDPTNIGDAGSTQIVESGLIYRTRRNADGKTGLVVIEIRNRKTLLDVSMGFQVNAHCVWRLNGVGCTESTHSPSAYAPRSAAVSIDGKEVSITDNTLIFDLAGTRSWTRGFIRYDNTTIGIFYYDKGTYDGQVAKTFQLVRQPPEEWEGEVVTFFPGCNKQPGDGGCGPTAWDNLDGFAGSGFAIPAHNPITENPQGDES